MNHALLIRAGRKSGKEERKTERVENKLVSDGS